MRALTAMVLALVVAACSSGPGGGGGGGGGGGVVPPGGVVWFGTGYDPASISLLGHASGGIKQGTPVAAVAKFHTPREPAKVQVSAVSGTTTKPATIAASNGTDMADIFAVDLTGLGLTPTTWQVNFTDPQGRIIASGFLTITP